MKKFKNILYVIFFLLSVIFIIRFCQSESSYEKRFASIKKGMRIEKVESILGKPPYYHVFKTPMSEANDSIFFDCCYMVDSLDDYHMVFYNRDSIVIYTEIQEED